MQNLKKLTLREDANFSDLIIFIFSLWIFCLGFLTKNWLKIAFAIFKQTCSILFRNMLCFWSLLNVKLKKKYKQTYFKLLLRVRPSIRFLDRLRHFPRPSAAALHLRSMYKIDRRVGSGGVQKSYTWKLPLLIN